MEGSNLKRSLKTLRSGLKTVDVKLELVNLDT